MFDAHDAFPILTLRLLRSRGASDQGVTSPSSPAAPDGGELKSCKGVDASSGVINNGGGGSSEDWSIISGGGDGTVAHLSVVGLASAREAASGVAEAGVELRMIGDYEVQIQIVGGRGSTHSILALAIRRKGELFFEPETCSCSLCRHQQSSGRNFAFGHLPDGKYSSKGDWRWVGLMDWGWIPAMVLACL